LPLKSKISDVEFYVSQNFHCDIAFFSSTYFIVKIPSRAQKYHQNQIHEKAAHYIGNNDAKFQALPRCD